MRVLVADDDKIGSALLSHSLQTWGYSVIRAGDGEEAWLALQADNPPQLAILDWMMPRLDGVDLCRRIRGDDRLRSLYIILLTAREKEEDLIVGLEAGANDYVVKPFKPAELQARVGVGLRVIDLQSELAGRIQELEHALAQVQTLKGLVPICAYCKKIRNEREYWERVESYISARTDARFSHGICPDCMAQLEKQHDL